MSDNSLPKKTSDQAAIDETLAAIERAETHKTAHTSAETGGEALADKTAHYQRVAEVSGNHDGGGKSVEIEPAAAKPLWSHNRNLAIVGAVALIGVIAILALFLWRRGESSSSSSSSSSGAREATNVRGKAEAGTVSEKGEAGEGGDVVLSPEALKAADLEYEGVTERPAVALLRVTGTVETNQQQTQSVTPLVGGRVERVNVRLGDRVSAGSVIATIASPEIAEMHGKLHESETQLALAERNYARVQRAENRVAVLSAKARLDEADATLKRTRRLIELGAGAGKDLVAAETAYRTAKADYDFQSNISLNRELQEARAAVETSRVDVAHIRDQMRALGAPVPEGERDDHSKDTSLVALRAPASGTVTERLVNPGAGVQAGTSLFTIANISTVWVIANVPEAQIGSLRQGTPAEVHSPALGAAALAGRVNYIDPKLDEATRTARVRVELANPGERLKAGMFVEVGFQAGTNQVAGRELVVPSAAVQRLESRTVVFIPEENEPGHFKARDVEVGGEVEGYTRVVSGLELGDKVVTKGSFKLKTQLMKGELGEE